jgi:hypothetical protein
MNREGRAAPAETLDLDACKDTGECSALKAVRRFSGIFV